MHNDAGYSEEKCVRCGWVMGHEPLNCQNDNTPHVFPSQLFLVDAARAVVHEWEARGDGGCFLGLQQKLRHALDQYEAYAPLSALADYLERAFPMSVLSRSEWLDIAKVALTYHPEVV